MSIKLGKTQARRPNYRAYGGLYGPTGHNWQMESEQIQRSLSHPKVLDSGESASADEKLSNIEKHQRVKNALLDFIGRAADGDPLPPERSLANDLGVARMTLRKVIDVLIAEGYLRRITDKGTFVTRSRVLRANGRQSFAHYESHGVASALAQVLEMVHENAGARMGQHLQLAPSAKVTKVVRLNLIADEPVAIEHIFLPTALFPTLQSEDFVSLLVDEFYERKFGIKVTRLNQVLRVTAINEFESSALSTPQHSPAFFVTTTKMDGNGRVIEYTKTVYRGDRYHFVNEVVMDDDLERRPSTSKRILFNPYFRIS